MSDFLGCLLSYFLVFDLKQQIDHPARYTMLPYAGALLSPAHGALNLYSSIVDYRAL
jgi:hypothetical protein